MSDDALIVFEAKDALATFTTEDPAATFDPILLPVRKAIDEFKKDASVQTTKGRKEIASFARRVVQCKTMLEEVGKDLADEVKKQPKLIDASRRYLKDTLDGWRDEVRAPLDQWEANEKARVAKHESEIRRIEELALLTFKDGRPLDAAQLRGNLDAVGAVAVSEEACEEYLDAYRSAKDKAVLAIGVALEAREQFERDQAELDRLRAENAAREAKEAAELAEREKTEREERIAQEAAQRAKEQAEQEAKAREEVAKRREEQLLREKEEAERRAQEAEAKAKREAEENARQEAEAQQRREADVEHKRAINQAAVAALAERGVTIDQAREIIGYIVRGEIPNIVIKY